jgi:nucleotide-binding universal stress UspA family protein
MYRDILVALIDDPADAGALEAAFTLARTSGGRVAALVAVPLYLPPAFEWGSIPADVYRRLHDEARAHASEVAAATRACWHDVDVPFEVRVVETHYMPSSGVAALHARYADLAVMAAPADATARRNSEALFLDLLLDSGRPVLRLPATATPSPLPPRRVVVAWKPTREAARAVHDALPLLRRAERVDVVSVDPVVDEHHHGEQPGADIAAHLARHGCRVEAVTRERGGESAGHVLLRHAASAGADLVVAGGFGHSRLREQWLGGFTRTLCEEATLPVLFSH